MTLFPPNKNVLHLETALNAKRQDPKGSSAKAVICPAIEFILLHPMQDELGRNIEQMVATFTEQQKSILG